ncbi:MAG: hypothetical protein KAW88_09200 [Candidatus Cloacimonetes bacterium]|nr:hypothetical protein [Candidatus Cloacimonadota bacterium]
MSYVKLKNNCLSEESFSLAFEESRENSSSFTSHERMSSFQRTSNKNRRQSQNYAVFGSAASQDRNIKNGNFAKLLEN